MSFGNDKSTLSIKKEHIISCKARQGKARQGKKKFESEPRDFPASDGDLKCIFILVEYLPRRHLNDDLLRSIELNELLLP